VKPKTRLGNGRRGGGGEPYREWGDSGGKFVLVCTLVAATMIQRLGLVEYNTRGKFDTLQARNLFHSVHVDTILTVMIEVQRGGLIGWVLMWVW